MKINTTFKLFINHLGYEQQGSKKFIVRAPENTSMTQFQLINELSETVYQGKIDNIGSVDRWHDWFFWQGDFSDLTDTGRYQIQIKTDDGVAFSHPFEIKYGLLPEECLTDLIFYFKGQRSSGIYDRVDSNAPFVGDRDERVDVHGGWYDASGDFSKYLSHLSYANYMNPQQIPMVVWGMAHTLEHTQDSQNPRLAGLMVRLQEETAHGADFLVRMQDPAGYFYMNIFDKWSHDPEQREICAYETNQGHKKDDYQAGYRQGGGMTIAALARVSTLHLSGNYTSKQCLETAEKGFQHLETHNLDYLNDGKENIIDDYCALFAATELYRATSNEIYLNVARRRKTLLIARLSKDDTYQNWWRADDTGERPYFHAAESGLPVMALLRYREIEPDSTSKKEALDAVEEALTFELTITKEVANPFGYARQYVKPLNEAKRTTFFFPHNNESGYWWQGENARLGSIASASLMAAPHFEGTFRQELQRHAINQLDWILGLNPYDISMMNGKGRNYPLYYEDGFPNAPGGVCNGITGGFDDEQSIDFWPDEHQDTFHNWRWAEQWIPHGGWLMIALSMIEETLHN